MTADAPTRAPAACEGEAQLRAVTTTTGLHRLRFLDGIRGLAALYVVVSHIWDTVFTRHLASTAQLRTFTAWLGFGRYAVALFIVVSGFSIGLGAWKGGLRWPGGNRAYLARRFMRIWPPYAVAVLLSSLLAATILSTDDGTLFDGANHIRASGVITHLLMIQDLHWAGPAGSTAFWSIPVEFDIYILFMVALVLLRRHVRAWIGLAVLAALLTAVVTDLPGVAVARWGAGLYPSLFALFLIGFAASRAVLAREDFDLRAWRRLMLAFAGLGLVLVLVSHAYWKPLSSLNDLVLGPLFALVIAELVVGRRRWLSRVLDSRVAVWLGDSSYSLYLTHAVVIELVWRAAVAPVTDVVWLRLVLELVLGVAASVLVSRLFFAWVERPFLRGREAARERARRPGNARAGERARSWTTPTRAREGTPS